MDKKNFVIIGLGGIGSILVNHLARFLNYNQKFDSSIVLLDGDIYEEKNLVRQDFVMLDQKAKTKAVEINTKFDNLDCSFEYTYVNEENVSKFIYDGDTVFVCVDNHKTRCVVSNYCKTLKNITLISGGNEFTDGNVQIYVKKGGKELTADLCAYHPEIANPLDKSPDEMSCEELAVSEPQLYFTNLIVATYMCCAYYNVLENNIESGEIYFDIKTLKAASNVRKPIN